MLEKVFITGVAIIFLFVGWVLFDSFFLMNRHRNEYLSFWYDEFKSFKSFDNAEMLTQKYRSDSIVTRLFAGGDWLAAITTSISQDKGFSAALLYDSKGRAFVFSDCLSGYEVLHGQINLIKADTLDEFYQNADNLRLIPNSPNQD